MIPPPTHWQRGDQCQSKTIGFDQAPQGMGRSQDRLDRLTSQAGSAAQSGGVTSDKAGQLSIAQTAPEYQRLTALHDRSNAVAATIRTMDQAMEAAGTTIDAMKKELEVITKNYPPFPPGSEERVRRLRSYAALRAMIDKLTIPPEEEARTLSGRERIGPLGLAGRVDGFDRTEWNRQDGTDRTSAHGSSGATSAGTYTAGNGE